jgi:hypothetical protein
MTFVHEDDFILGIKMIVVHSEDEIPPRIVHSEATAAEEKIFLPNRQHRGRVLAELIVHYNTPCEVWVVRA